MAPSFCWVFLMFILCAPIGVRGPSPSPPSPGSFQPSSSWSTPSLQVIPGPLNNAYAFFLYRKLISKMPRKNILFSPVSILDTLATLSLGARSATRSQILQSLGLEPPHTPDSAMPKSLGHLMSSLQRGPQDPAVKMVTKIFIPKDLALKAEFLEEAWRLYGSQMFPVDFSIASQVLRYTQDLKPLMPMEVVNQLMFRGQWEKPFEPADAYRNVPFLVQEGASMKVPMMHQVGKFLFTEDHELNCSVLQIKFKRNYLALFVLPGEGGLPQLEQALSEDRMQRWTHLFKKRMVEVFLPRLSMSTSYHLKNIFLEMGIRDAFDKNANFSGITERDFLFVSDVFHHVLLNVTEDGTEALARTTRFNVQWENSPPDFTISFSKSFLYMIIHQRTDTIYFLGKVVDPTHCQEHNTQ